LQTGGFAMPQDGLNIFGTYIPLPTIQSPPGLLGVHAT